MTSSFETGEYGNGASWASLVGDVTLSVPRLKSFASWFVVLQARPGTMHLDDGPTMRHLEPPRPTSPGGDEPRLIRATGTRFVFRVCQGPASPFAFISVGRNSNNDLYVPDESISRFHAFFREIPASADVVLVDTRSHNGTSLRGAPVPRQGEGDAPLVRNGDVIRFGEVTGVVLDAAGLFAQLSGR